MTPPDATRRNPLSDEPIYNVRAVALQTGLSAVTLRAWERRYGFPAPQRTASGYRLYTGHDIQLLRWLKGQVDQGMAISQAIALLNSLRTAGQDPASATSPAAGERPGPVPPVTYNLDELVARLFAAATHFDEAAAEETLNLAFATHSVEDVCLGLFVPLMQTIGESWQSGDVSAQTEHFASNVIRERLLTLIHATPPPHRAGRVVAACAPDEWHELGLLIVSLFARRQGLALTYLGQNVPVDHIVEAVEQIEPAVLLVASSSVFTAAGVLDIAGALAALPPAQRPRLAFGGRVFARHPEVHPRIPGSFAGPGAREAVAMVLELAELGPGREPARPAPTPAGESAARAALHQHEDELVLGVTQHMQRVLHSAGAERDALYPHVRRATRDLGTALDTALRFAEPRLLGELAAWLGDMLAARGVPRGLAVEHVRAYTQAVARYVPDAEARTLQRYLAGLEVALAEGQAAGHPPT